MVLICTLLFLGALSAAQQPDAPAMSLQRAAEAGDVERVRGLLDSGVDIDGRDVNGSTALMHAASNGRAEVATVLIEKGAGLNARDRSGQTALMFAAFNGHVGLVRLLLDRGADINARSFSGVTALSGAAYLKQVEIARLLAERGADVNLRNDAGGSALTYAASADSVDLAKLLIARGADVNARDRNGLTAVDYAHDQAIIDLLVAHGAKKANGSPGVRGIPPVVFLPLVALVGLVFGGLARASLRNLRKRRFLSAFFYLFLLSPVVIPLLYVFHPLKYLTFLASGLVSFIVIAPRVSRAYVRQTASWRITCDTEQQLTVVRQMPYRWSALLIVLSLASMVAFALAFSGVLSMQKNLETGMALYYLGTGCCLLLLAGWVVLRPGREKFDFQLASGLLYRFGKGGRKESAREIVALRDLSTATLEAREGGQTIEEHRVFGSGPTRQTATWLGDLFAVVLTLPDGRKIDFGCGMDVEFAVRLRSRLQSIVERSQSLPLPETASLSGVSAPSCLVVSSLPGGVCCSWRMMRLPTVGGAAMLTLLFVFGGGVPLFLRGSVGLLLGFGDEADNVVWSLFGAILGAVAVWIGYLLLKGLTARGVIQMGQDTLWCRTTYLRSVHNEGTGQFSRDGVRSVTAHATQSGGSVIIEGTGGQKVEMDFPVGKGYFNEADLLWVKNRIEAWRHAPAVAGVSRVGGFPGVSGGS